MEQGVAFNAINLSFTHRTVQNSTVVGLALTCFLCPKDLELGGKLHSYEIRGKNAADGKTREVRVSPTGEVLEME
jgi:hypothetical protein